MRRYPCVLLLAIACSSGSSKVTGGDGVVVDSSQKVSIDPARVPFTANCAAGQVVERAADGSWTCAKPPTWDSLKTGITSTEPWPGAVDAASVSGTVTVQTASGAALPVSVSNTPQVSISGTPSVSISGTPTVALSGTASVSVTAPGNPFSCSGMAGSPLCSTADPSLSTYVTDLVIMGGSTTYPTHAQSFGYSPSPDCSAPYTQLFFGSLPQPIAIPLRTPLRIPAGSYLCGHSDDGATVFVSGYHAP